MEVQQRKARKENREKSLALRDRIRRKKRSYAEKPRKQVRTQETNTDNLSDTDGASENSTEDVTD